MRLEKYQYLIMSLDPVHIGTGGYRLGRVDNAIVREPGTNIPKIPGTSLHGSIRSASAMRYGKPESAGQRPKGYPGSDPIVYTFGAGEEGGFSSGVANISDAQVLLFPIASQNGPVWITTSDVLKEAEFGIEKPPSAVENVLLSSGLSGIDGKFPLGWVMLEIESNNINISSPNDSTWANESALTEALKRTVVVHRDIFSELVNSGLEVRTSVAINPNTGAAEHGALFTYEAIPRATFLTFDVVLDDYRTEKKLWPITKTAKRENGTYKENAGESLGEEWKGPYDVLKAGCQLLEYLGIGGMGTRGFGRIKIIGKPKTKFPLSSKTQENADDQKEHKNDS
jgi:CRISPR-associated protein Cmr4